MRGDPTILVVQEVRRDREEEVDVFLVRWVIELEVNPDSLVHNNDVVAVRRYGVFAQLPSDGHPIGWCIVLFAVVGPVRWLALAVW